MRTRGVVVGAVLVAAAHGWAVAPVFPGATTTTYTSAEPAAVIPDAGSLVSLLAIAGTNGDVVDIDVTVDITHGQPDQLDISLISPTGTTITLTTDNGGGNDDVFAGTTFDDQAPGEPSAPNVRNFTYTNLVATGPMQPEEALGAVVGEPADGPWALVIVDDSGGTTGTIHGWSITLTTVPAGSLTPSPPATFAGDGDTIPDNLEAGLVAPITVSGAGTRLLDLNVAVDVQHLSSGQLDFFLTAPSGRRIDLVTRYGGGNDDLYAGATFDDHAGTPIADLTLPTSPDAFSTVVGEGALAAFLGENPNGAWTLTVADRTFGTIGTLASWSLTLVTAGICGDGMLDSGETCDDGNATAGDGCEPTCLPTPPPPPGSTEADCANCVDDDGDGLIDALDPDCGATALTLGSGRAALRGSRSTLLLKGTLPVPELLDAPVSLVVADGNGLLACSTLDSLRGGGTGPKLVAKGSGLQLVVVRRAGRFTIRGRGLDLTAFDDMNVTVGARIGTVAFKGGIVFRERNPSLRVAP